MSGPFSTSKICEHLHRHLVTSPLSVAKKAGRPGKLCLVQNFFFKQADGVSVNDFIDSNLFPTQWRTALLVAAIVSVLVLSLLHLGGWLAIGSLHSHTDICVSAPLSVGAFAPMQVSVCLLSSLPEPSLLVLR